MGRLEKNSEAFHIGETLSEYDSQELMIISKQKAKVVTVGKGGC